MGKSRIRDKADNLAKADGFYHWYDESTLTGLEADRDTLRTLLHPLAFGEPSARISPRQRSKFQRIMKKNAATIPIRVATLLEICELLHISPESLERMKLFKRDYPIPLAHAQIYRLMTHVINEGSVKKGKYPRGVYCNLDLSLHERVSQLITSLGSHGNRRIGKDNVPETYVSAAMAKLLIKAGLVPGKKTRGQYFHHLPKQILDNHVLSKYHMSATLTEEGSPSLRFNVGSRPSISIAYTRSIDVTDTLTSEYIDSLEKEKKYYIGKIPDAVRSKIRLLPFPLLEDEVNLLRRKFGIDVHTSLKSIYKSKQDRVTAEWGAVFSSAEAIKKFKDRIGFLPGSRVEKRFEMILKLYEENKNKALSQEDVDRIGKELRQS